MKHDDVVMGDGAEHVEVSVRLSPSRRQHRVSVTQLIS
jgi:hypothetical protein